MSKDNYVAVTYKACPICGKKDEEQSEVLLHRRFGDISKLHNQINGYGHPCKECKEMTDKAILFIVIDEDKSENIQDPYRTGEMYGMSEEYVNRVITEPLLEQILRVRFTYIDWKTAKYIGLPVKYTG